MWLANAAINWENCLFLWFPTSNPMAKIRFDYATVTISDGVIQAPSPTLTALLDTLAATIPGYGSLPFEFDADFNIARGLIETIGVGKIAHRCGLSGADNLLSHSTRCEYWPRGRLMA